MINVEFLYFEGCPGHEPAFALLQEVLEQEDLEVEVSRINLTGPEVVEERRFLGSPSIRIDGVDLEGREAEETQGYGWRCRYYQQSEPGQSKAVPARELIRQRLREQAGRV